MLGATAEDLGPQSYSLGTPGYWAPVRQQPCMGLSLLLVLSLFWTRSFSLGGEGEGRGRGRNTEWVK